MSNSKVIAISAFVSVIAVAFILNQWKAPISKPSTQPSSKPSASSSSAATSSTRSTPKAKLLTEDEKEVIGSTFQIVEQNTDLFAATFYGNLFETIPGIKALFTGDMQRQGRLIVAMIKSAIRMIDEPEDLVDTLKDLTKRHVSYGVKAAHYGPAGGCLVFALDQILKEKFTPRAKAAWIKVYTLISDVMVAASREEEAKAELTEADIAIIAATFQLVEERQDEFASKFYNRLFEIADVRHLFRNSDMQRQGRLLVGMVKTAVRYIKDPSTLVPAVQALGVRHVGYGVRPEHYDSVGAALIWTLNDMFKEKFTPAVKTAWVKVYTLLSTVAVAAANEYEASASTAAPAPATGKCPF